MWYFMKNNSDNGVKIDDSKSFYVGDAAGRAKNWAPGKPKDFSCSDRMFAHNVGIGKVEIFLYFNQKETKNLIFIPSQEFHTPEEFFFSEKLAPFEWGSINPNDILKSHTDSKNDNKTYHDSVCDLVFK